MIVGSVYNFTEWEGAIFRLAVLPLYRKKGIGSLLMQEAEKRLKEKGALEVQLFVHEDDIEVQEYYRKRGFKDNKKWLNMFKKL